MTEPTREDRISRLFIDLDLATEELIRARLDERAATLRVAVTSAAHAKAVNALRALMAESGEVPRG